MRTYVFLAWKDLLNVLPLVVGNYDNKNAELDNVNPAGHGVLGETAVLAGRKVFNTATATPLTLFKLASRDGAVVLDSMDGSEPKK